MRYFEKIALDTAVSHTKSQSDFLENSGYKNTGALRAPSFIEWHKEKNL